MCDYQGYEFGAGRYPDSVCIDGRLYDADNCDGYGNLYEPAENIPCPMCNPKGCIAYHTDQNRFGGESAKNARAAARSLVADIRKNRGVLHMRALSANSESSRAASAASAGTSGSAADGGSDAN